MPLEQPITFTLMTEIDLGAGVELVAEHFGPDFDNAWDAHKETPGSVLLANGQDIRKQRTL